MPKIGYGSARKTRNYQSDGFKSFLVKNVGELEILLMQNRKYSCVIAKQVSLKNKLEIIKRAKILNVKVANIGRLESVEV
jgi:large subunit ribosomal protein L32e